MQGAASQSIRLPKLRSELALLRGAPLITGEPTWLIHDPLQNRYIQIDQAAYEVFSLWADCTTVVDLLAQVQSRHRTEIDDESILRLVEFAAQNKLIDPAHSGVWKSIAHERKKHARSLLSWLVHNYLFVKVPLFRPQAFLERMLPKARLLASPSAIGLIVLAGLIGLYLVSRQWDQFASTFQHLFTWEGALLAVLSICIVKIAHELGHAFTATHYGCRVPSMGIAFMLAAPLLYSDVTDAWRLRDRRQRLFIAAAGVFVELALAALALFAWAFLPDGPMRSVAFTLSVVSLATTLLINLNPLMRFDGYYLLADWVGIENLQSRSFDLARWKLREWLFGLGIPCAEQISQRHRTFMIAYGWAVWIYRLMLFFGIALLVYHYFFKLLGIALFAFEIGYFIVGPVWSEIKIWIALRRPIAASRRYLATCTACAGLMVLGIVPWSTRVEIPAVLEPVGLAKVFPVRSSRIEAIHAQQGQTVEAGELLVTLASPDVDRDIEVATVRLRLARMQHARRVADQIDREATLELESNIASLITRIEGLERERRELVIRAPVAGTVVELNGEIHPGRWIGAKEMIALIVDRRGQVARGYVSEADLWRIEPGRKGFFIPEAPQRPSASLAVTDVGMGGSGQIEIVDLASTYGGRIAVNPDEKRRLVPLSAQYAVRMMVTSPIASGELLNRGVALIQGRPESLLAHLWRQVTTVLVRESGF